MKIQYQHIRTTSHCIVPLLFPVLISSLLLISCSKSDQSKYTVLKGPFRQSIIETGELQAEHSSIVIMPRINSI